MVFVFPFLLLVIIIFYFFLASVLSCGEGGGGWVTPEYWCSVWRHGSVDRESGLWEKKRKGGEGGKEVMRKEGRGQGRAG